MTKKELIKTLKRVLRNEKLIVDIYRILAEREKNLEARSVLFRMAETENKYIEQCSSYLNKLGIESEKLRESSIDKVRRAIILKSSTELVIKIFNANQTETNILYKKLVTTSESETDKNIFSSILSQKKAHLKMIEEIIQRQAIQKQINKIDKLIETEYAQKSIGEWIEQTINNTNIGLSLVLYITSFIAGASAINNELILLSGFSAIIALILLTSRNLIFNTTSEKTIMQENLDKDETEHYYYLKGFNTEDAKKMAEKLSQQPQEFINIFSDKELSITKKSLSKKFIFTLGAIIIPIVVSIIPLVPFILFSGRFALISLLIIIVFIYYIAYSLKSLISGCSLFNCLIKITSIKISEASISYLLGLLIASIL